MYQKLKKKKTDVCNICLHTKKLSWDHVPPQGSITLAPVELRKLLEIFAVKNPEDAPAIFNPDGVKFRSICAKCNGDLGTEFDPTLNKFSHEVGRVLKLQDGGLYVPEIINIRTKPVRLMRAILGHLVSAMPDLRCGPFDEAVRDVLFDFTKPIPTSINIFYWVYPHQGISILRDFGMPSIRGNLGSELGFYHMLKFFPLAYLVSDKTPYDDCSILTQFRNLGIDDEVEIPINLKFIKHQFWPEWPADRESFIFGGLHATQGIFAVPGNLLGGLSRG